MIVLVRAEVIGQQDKTYTVKLLNGFGRPEEIIHESAIVGVEPSTGEKTREVLGLSGCVAGR